LKKKKKEKKSLIETRKENREAQRKAYASIYGE